MKEARIFRLNNDPEIFDNLQKTLLIKSSVDSMQGMILRGGFEWTEPTRNLHSDPMPFYLLPLLR